ncbi:unnamed protein product [Chrysodeixis includens]|uniref:Uncharacterized protein n=1 Tax=Chrysodeixis includens TaxID=689277 RepID=A0A9N8KVI8_CHRIL|nr:unnamed protein product [Chrysodeixis includens]
MRRSTTARDMRHATRRACEPGQCRRRGASRSQRYIRARVTSRRSRAASRLRCGVRLPANPVTDIRHAHARTSAVAKYYDTHAHPPRHRGWHRAAPHSQAMGNDSHAHARCGSNGSGTSSGCKASSVASWRVRRTSARGGGAAAATATRARSASERAETIVREERLPPAAASASRAPHAPHARRRRGGRVCCGHTLQAACSAPSAHTPQGQAEHSTV